MTRSSAGILVFFVPFLAFFVVTCGTDSSRATHRQNPRPQSRPTSPARSGLSQLWIGEDELWLEVAHNSTSRARGLSGRSSLDANSGMIFLYAIAEERRFWMKNTWVALDVAFVDDTNRIIKIVSLDPPPVDCPVEDLPRAISKVPARYVVEMPKGWFAANGHGVSTTIRFSPELNKIASGLRK